jgi:hypothetical protein
MASKAARNSRPSNSPECVSGRCPCRPASLMSASSAPSFVADHLHDRQFVLAREFPVALVVAGTAMTAPEP